MIDVADLKRHTDLLSVVEAELGPPTGKSGRWFNFVCPFHLDSTKDGGSLRVTPDTGTWFCFGCQKTGDVIKWVQERHNLTFPEACKYLGVSSPAPKFSSPVSRQTSKQPDPTWQQTAAKILQRSQSYLWGSTGNRALDYLHKRGLTDETIRHWGIGYNPGQYSVREITTAQGKPAQMGKGHVIPVYVDGELRLLKIRQSDSCNPRYVRLSGGETALFGTETLPGHSKILLTEGEFDAMLVWQEAADLVGTASTTGGCKVWHREWLIYLLAAKTVLVAYDNDPAGDEAATTVCSCSPRMQRVVVPIGKDVTEFYQRGGNVRQWIESLV